jgi:hypothetical protein
MTSPYAPPESGAPKTMLVVHAYRAYAALMFVYYLALAITFGFFVESGLAMPIASGVFAVVYAAAFVAPRAPWGWTLGLVAIGVGMASVWIVFAIPLLIAWLRPATKAAFRRLP